MKFSEYIRIANDLLEERPEVGEYEVVYASDEEGNSFSRLYSFFTIGYYDSEDEDFIGETDYIEEDEEEFMELNSVCIN